ncbi:FecCD family ABC transporter permease [Halocalculus aciditolerans]|uniref:Cobalamin import system permease protein BtuC n=1 Tax=Halocalculus aciditolerans TaxID=1383812 RepID=A0A830F9W5_9EURY|nr:iron ABC transporter permease [Halocalculus aciditolerans]GGL68740.1 iron(3+)-hydroxamate ABC transporter permease [Halocalculus aciditolerans]
MTSEETSTATRDGHPFVDPRNQRLAGLVVGSTLIVLVGAFIQVSQGSYGTPFGVTYHVLTNPHILFNPDVWAAFFTGSDLPEWFSRDALIIWSLRMPRVFVAALVGVNLAISGAIFQAITRNELASPYVLGVSGGAGLAVLVTLVFFASATYVLPFAAAVGGALAFLLVYAIAWKRGTSPVRLVLAGVVVATVFQSLQTGLFYFLDSTGAVKTAIAWTTGSLTGVGWQQVRLVALPTLIVLPVAVAAARHLNVLLLGEKTARSLGMSVERIRFGLSGLAILAAAAAVSVAGLVGFVGLVVPHVVRTVVGSDYKRLVVGCIFAGPALMVAADVIARLALNPVQVPVGVVTGVIGGPYFLYLMRRHEDFSAL